MDKESIFKPERDAKLVKREKIAKLGVRQQHSVVKQIQGVQFETLDDGSTTEEQVYLPQIAPNPKDRALLGRLSASPSRPSMVRNQDTIKETISLNSQDIANYYTDNHYQFAPKEPVLPLQRPSMESLAGSVAEAQSAESTPYAIGPSLSVITTVNNSLSAPRRDAHQELSRNQSLATYGIKPAVDLTPVRGGDPNASTLDQRHLYDQSMLTVASSPYKPGPAGLSALASKNHSISEAALPNRHTARLASQASQNLSALGSRSQRSQSVLSNKLSAFGTNSVRSALKLHNQHILR